MNFFSISSSPRGPEPKASNIRPTVLLLRKLLKQARVCLSLSPAMCNLHLGVELPDQLRRPKVGSVKVVICGQPLTQPFISPP